MQEPTNKNQAFLQACVIFAVIGILVLLLRDIKPLSTHPAGPPGPINELSPEQGVSSLSGSKSPDRVALSAGELTRPQQDEGQSNPAREEEESLNDALGDSGVFILGIPFSQIDLDSLSDVELRSIQRELYEQSARELQALREGETLLNFPAVPRSIAIQERTNGSEELYIKIPDASLGSNEPQYARIPRGFLLGVEAIRECQVTLYNNDNFRSLAEGDLASFIQRKESQNIATNLSFEFNQSGSEIKVYSNGHFLAGSHQPVLGEP